MLYQRPSFTCPAAPQNTTQQQWDFAMLSKKEYIAKYKISVDEYETLKRG